MPTRIDHRKKYLTVAILAALGAHASNGYAAGAVTVGSEFRANSETSGAQQFSAVAADAVGNFAVTWESLGHPAGDNYDIHVRVFGSTASAVTGDLLVNSVANGGLTNGAQRFPDVAMDADGDFVVVWSGAESGATPQEIMAQRYNSAGTPQSSNFRVNTETSGGQQNAAVAMDALGNFVVAYESAFDFLRAPCTGIGADALGIAAQRFNAAGTPQGTEIQYVHSYCTGAQGLPDVAMDSDGDFVVVWQSPLQDGSGAGIFGQRFDETGAPQGTEFQVNTHITGDQVTPSVAMDAAGNFLVAWASDLQDGSGNGVYAKLFNAAGVAQTGDVKVNTTTAGSQENPSVSADGNGNFLVAWQDSNAADGALSGVFAQAVSSTGSLLGGQIQLNTHTTNEQRLPAVASDSAGDFIAVWQSLLQDGFAEGIYGQRGTVTPADLDVKFDFDGDVMSDILWRHDTNGQNSIWLMDGRIADFGNIASVSDNSWKIYGVGDFDDDGQDDILWRHDTNGQNSIWLMDGRAANFGNIASVSDNSWKIRGVGDFDGDGKDDILWRHDTNGQNSIWLMNGRAANFGNIASVSDNNWKIRGVGDFDGDGMDDILWRHDTNGQNSIWLMNGRTASFGNIPSVSDNNWKIRGVGDFDGDGNDDILWRHDISGLNSIWTMDGRNATFALIPSVSDTDWEIVGVADYNGDGKSDILLRHKTNGQNSIWLMDGLNADFGNIPSVTDLGWKVKP